ncbi:AAEL009163-PA, partial [Aedes aegypti]
IDRLLAENRMPIIVGGTNYYIESVLWQVLVGSGIPADQAEKVLLMTTEQMEQLESTLLHGVLRRVDPVTADRLHPNNKRKIVR